MKSYKLNTEENKEILKKTKYRTIFFMVISVVIGQVVVINAISDTDQFKMVLMVSIPLILIVTGISIFTALKRQKKILDSAEIIIEENFITKKQFNTTDSRIGRTDIKTISEDSLGNIIISPDSLQKSIIIPKTVERRDELKEDLNGFKEIEPFKHTSKSKLSLALNAITIVAFIISYASETKEIVIVTGSIAVIGLIWNLRTIQTSSQVDKRTKRISWFIILPLLSIVAKIFSYLN